MVWQWGFAIRKIYFINYSKGERFYFRFLVFVWQVLFLFSLCMVWSIFHPTIKEVRMALGLLENNDKWMQYLEETLMMHTWPFLPNLFAFILNDCHPSHPKILGKQFRTTLCDDFRHRLWEQYDVVVSLMTTFTNMSCFHIWSALSIRKIPHQLSSNGSTMGLLELWTQ